MNRQEHAEGQIENNLSPFQEEIVVDHFFHGGGRGAIIADMLHAIAGLIPILVLTGEEGSGKTMLCRVLENEVPPNCIPVFFADTVESFDDVVRIVAQSVGMSAASASKSDVPSLLHDIGSQLRERNERLIVIFDQAERIYLATLERVRKMLDRINESGVVMQIVLSGRNLLRDNMQQLAICNFAEVEEKQYQLSPLSAEETNAYLQHCIDLLAGEEPSNTFSVEICEKIYSAAGGNFRMTNILADESLKNQDKDASFWVLLESVQEQGADAQPEREKQKRMPFQLPRVSLRTLAYVGGALCLVVLLLQLLPGNDGEVPKGESPQQHTSVAQTAKEPSRPAVQQEDLVPPTEIQESSTAQDETEPQTDLSAHQSELVEEALGKEPAREVAAEESVALLEPEYSATEVVEPAVEIETDAAGEATARRDTATDVEVVADAPSAAQAEVESEEPVRTTTVKKTVEEEQPETVASNIVISSLTQAEKERIENTRTTTLASQEHKKKPSQQGASEASGMLEDVSGQLESGQVAVETAGQGADEGIATIRKTRPVKVKVEPLQQIEVDRTKIKVPVVEQAIVPNTALDGVNAIYRSRLVAGRSWLTGDRDDHYTIQLMVLTSDTAEENFKQMLADENYRREADNFYLFHKDGAPSSLLVFYGEYANMTAARNARNNIPVFLRGHRPYAISVQGAMRKVQSN